MAKQAIAGMKINVQSKEFRENIKKLNESVNSAGRASKKFKKQWRKDWRQAKRAMSDSVKRMTILAAGLTASLVALSKQSIDNADNLIKNSRAVNINFDAYQRLTFSLGQAGLAAGTFDKSTIKLQKAIVDASDGLKTYSDQFDKLGLSTDELLKLSPDQQFIAVVKALEKVENVTTRTAIAASLFGSKAAIAFGSTLDGGIENILKVGESLLTMNKKAAESAELINDTFDVLKTEFSNSLLNALEPILIELNTYLRNNRESIAEFGVSVANLIKDLIPLIQTIVKFASKLNGMAVVIGTVVFALSPMIIATGKILKLMLGLNGGVTKFIPLLTKGTTGIAGFGVAIRTLLGFITGPVGLIISLGTLVGWLVKNEEAVDKWIKQNVSDHINKWKSDNDDLNESLAKTNEELIKISNSYTNAYSHLAGEVGYQDPTTGQFAGRLAENDANSGFVDSVIQSARVIDDSNKNLADKIVENSDELGKVTDELNGDATDIIKKKDDGIGENAMLDPERLAELKTAYSEVNEETQRFKDQFGSNMGQAFANVLTGSQNLAEGIRGFFNNMAQEILNDVGSQIGKSIVKGVFGFAEGGVPPLNTPVLVGEGGGPELVTFGQTARVHDAVTTQKIFNESADRMNAGGVTYNISVNIDGDTDTRTLRDIQQRAPEVANIITSQLESRGERI